MSHDLGNTIMNTGPSPNSRTNLTLQEPGSSAFSHHHQQQRHWLGHTGSTRQPPPPRVPNNTNPAYAAIVGSENQLLLCTEIMPKDVGNESEDELDREIQYLSKEIMTLNTTRIATTTSMKSTTTTTVDINKGKSSKSSNTALTTTKRKTTSTNKSGRHDDDDTSTSSNDDSTVNNSSDEDNIYTKKKKKKKSLSDGVTRTTTATASSSSKTSAAALKSMEAKRAKRKTQAKKRHARYDEDMELDLVRNSQILCQSWDSLRLGTDLGTPAYNEYLRKQLFGGGRGVLPTGICAHNERRVPQFKSEEMLQIIRNLRPPQTVPPLPPPMSSLGSGSSNSERRMVDHRRNTSNGSGDGGKDNLKDSAAEGTTYSRSSSSSSDNEVRAINGDSRRRRRRRDMSMVVDDVDSESSDNSDDEEYLNHVTSSLVSDVTKLYENMCWQDADDWNCFRRYANNNLSSNGVVDKLRNLERNALFMDDEEARVLKIAREVGLYHPGGRQISEDISFFMGYGGQYYDDLDV